MRRKVSRKLSNSPQPQQASIICLRKRKWPQLSIRISWTLWAMLVHKSTGSGTLNCHPSMDSRPIWARSWPISIRMTCWGLSSLRGYVCRISQLRRGSVQPSSIFTKTSSYRPDLYIWCFRQMIRVWSTCQHSSRSSRLLSKWSGLTCRGLTRKFQYLVSACMRHTVISFWRRTW